MLAPIKYACLVVFSFALAAPTLAAAQWDAPPEGQPPPTVVAPEPPPAPPPTMADDASLEPAKKGVELHTQWGIDIGVPVFLNVDSKVARPGASIQFWGGADWEYFFVGLFGGLQWNPVDFGKASDPSLQALGRSPLSRIYFGPEIRVQFPAGRGLPYISGTFDVNFWNFRETGLACGWWYCSQVSTYRFTPGYSGKAGAAVRVGKGTVHIDFGFKWALTGKGDFFRESGWWLEGYAGILIRRVPR